MGFFSNVLNTIKKSSRSRFDLNKDTNTLQLLLDTADENYFTLEFDTMKIEQLFDPSTQEAKKIIATHKSLGTIYIESIRLQHNKQWNCSAGSAFDIFIKEQFQKEKINYIDSYSGNFFKLTKYELNYENEFAAIWFCLNQFEVFIIDPKGQLSNDLFAIYDLKNKNLLIKDITTEISLDINTSLTQTNLRENYFS
jgi:hypothetical protein